MTKFLTKIIATLLVSAAFVACNPGFLSEQDILNGDGVLVINGIVSDQTEGTPVEDIKIVFNAYQSEKSDRVLLTRTEYTSSKGVYLIRVEGLSENIFCRISAEDEKGIYSSCSTSVNVTWNGNAYDKGTNTFAVNGCNFHLPKK